MDEIRYSVAIWLLTLTTSFRSHKYSYNLRSVMQQRISSSTLGYPWINYRKRTRNVSKYKETHMRGDAFLPNGDNTQVTSFLLFRQCNWTRSKKKKKQSSPLSAFSSACVDGPGSGVCGPGAGISPSTSNSVSFSKFSLQYNRRLS